MNTATKETAPWHIWLDSVCQAAGATSPTGGLRERMVRAYQSGEPVWMAADELRLRSRATTKKFVCGMRPGLIALRANQEG